MINSQVTLAVASNEINELAVGYLFADMKSWVVDANALLKAHDLVMSNTLIIGCISGAFLSETFYGSATVEIPYYDEAGHKSVILNGTDDQNSKALSDLHLTDRYARLVNVRDLNYITTRNPLWLRK